MKREPQIPKAPEPEPNNSNLRETLQLIIDEFDKKGAPIELDLSELSSKTGRGADEIQKTLTDMGYDINESPAVKPEEKVSPAEKPKKRSQPTKQMDKTDWTDVDHKLEDAVNRLRQAKDEAEKEAINAEIKLLKEKKFPELKQNKASLTRKPLAKPTSTQSGAAPGIPVNVYSEDILDQIDAKEEAREKASLDEKLQKAVIEYAYGKSNPKSIPIETTKTPIDSSAYEDDYIPKSSEVEAVKEAVLNKAQRDFIESVPSKAFENDYTPRERSTEEGIHNPQFESKLETIIKKALEPTTDINTIVSAVIALAKTQNDAQLFSATIQKASRIVGKMILGLKSEPENDNYSKEAREGLIEIINKLSPQALEAEKNSTSHKIDFANYENGKTNFDVDPEVIVNPTSVIEPPANPEVPAVSEEKTLEAIKTIENRRAERIKKLGSKFINGIQSIEKKYNSIPLKYRLGISATMLALSYGAGGAGAGINLGYRVIMTSISMVSLERLLASQIQGERTTWQKTRHVTEAVSLAILMSFFSEIKSAVASGVDQASAIRDWLNETPKLTDSTTMSKTPEVFPNLTEEESLRNLEAMRAIDNANSSSSEIAKTATTETTTQTTSTSSQTTPTPEALKPAEVISSYTVASGDNLTKIIQEKILANSGLEGARLTNATENILSAMRADPTKFGVTSGDLNLIKVGENIDIAKIKELADSISINGKNIIETANNLSAEQVANISNYKPNVADVVSSVTSSNPNVSEALSNSVNSWSGEGVGNEEVIEKIPDEPITNKTSENATSNSTETIASNQTQKTINSELIEQVKFKADIELRQLVESKFGSKGIFGLFKSDGMNIWDNIKDIPVAKLDEFAKVGAFEAGSAEAKSFLVQPSTRDATFNILSELQEATGLKPAEKETIGKFISRMLEDTKMKALTSTKNITA